MADIAANRLNFAVANGYAGQSVTLEMRRPRDLEEGLSWAKHDAASLVEKNGGQKFARTFECTGAESCVRLSIHVSACNCSCPLQSRKSCRRANTQQATRSAGKVLLVGMGTPVQTLPVSAAALREVDLIGVWRYTNCYPQAMEIMQAAGKDRKSPDLRKLITHAFRGLDKAAEALSMASQTSDNTGSLVIKVAVVLNE